MKMNDAKKSPTHIKTETIVNVPSELSTAQSPAPPSSVSAANCGASKSNSSKVSSMVKRLRRDIVLRDCKKTELRVVDGGRIDRGPQQIDFRLIFFEQSLRAWRLTLQSGMSLVQEKMYIAVWLVPNAHGC